MEEKPKEETQPISEENRQTTLVTSDTLSLNDQTPSKRQSLKRLSVVVVLLVVIGVGVALNKPYIETILNRTQKPSAQQSNSTTEKRDLKKIELGEKTLVIKPGENYRLADDETTIQFGGSTIPDLVFGEHYSLNDIHKINSLAINNEVSFYNKGYYFQFRKTGCNTKTVFTDVPEVHVTDCSLQYVGNQATAPIKGLKSFSKQFNLRDSNDSSLTNTPSEPLVYVAFPRASLQNYSTKQLSSRVSLETGSMTSYSADTPWDIQIISSYGIDTLRFTAEEIWNKQSKTSTIGALNVKAEVKDYTCKLLFRGNNGEQTEQCDDIIVELQISDSGSDLVPIKLETYKGK